MHPAQAVQKIVPFGNSITGPAGARNEIQVREEWSHVGPKPDQTVR